LRWYAAVSELEKWPLDREEGQRADKKNRENRDKIQRDRRDRMAMAVMATT